METISYEKSTSRTRALKKKIKAMRIFSNMLMLIVLVLLVTTFVQSKQNSELKKYNSKCDSAIGKLIEENEKLKEENLALEVENNELREVVKSVSRQLKNVSDINESYVDELNKLRGRLELYNKYEYAIYDDNKRTQLTYEEIQYGEELMLAKGLDPHLMFATIMVESSGNPNDVNPSSSATGYGQFLNSTAKWVWTSLLGNDSYYPDIRKDGKSNILMIAEYYDYLYSRNSSTFSVVKRYSGNSTNEGAQRYLNRLNKFTRKVGASIN